MQEDTPVLYDLQNENLSKSKLQTKMWIHTLDWSLKMAENLHLFFLCWGVLCYGVVHLSVDTCLSGQKLNNFYAYSHQLVYTQPLMVG
jgi:hypothetical protein